MTKFSTLLAGVAAAAMLGGVASAQYTFRAEIGGVSSIKQTAPTGTQVQPAGAAALAGSPAITAPSGAPADAASRLFLASELPSTGAALVSALDLALEAQGFTLTAGAGAIPPAALTATTWGTGSALLRIDLSGANFNAPVGLPTGGLPIGAFADGQAGAGSLANTAAFPAGAGCVLAPANIVDGGGAGQNFVVYQIPLIEDCQGRLVLNGSQVVMTGSSMNVSASLTSVGSGAAINGGSRDTSGTYGAFVQRVSALQAAGSNTAKEATIASGFGALAGGANLGSVAIRTGHRSVGTGGLQTDVVVSKSLAGAAVAGADVTGVSLGINMGDAAGFNLAGFTLGALPSTQTGTVSGSGVQWQLSATQRANAHAPAGTSIPVNAAYTSPAGSIQAQTVTASVAATFDALSNLQNTGTVSAGTLSTITRAGVSSGLFTWVGDGNTVNRSVFRHTGFLTCPTSAACLPADRVPMDPLPAIRIAVSNATNGASFNGEYLVPAGALSVSSGGEVITNSDIIRSIVGDFGRANIRFSFEANGISTQRFVQTAGGALTGAPANCTGANEC